MNLDSPKYELFLQDTLLAVLSPEGKPAQLNGMKPERSLIKALNQTNARHAALFQQLPPLCRPSRRPALMRKP